MTNFLFKNRIKAGQKLGQKLKKLGLKNPVVLAIPNGGVVVGKQVAKVLACPIAPLVSEKIYFPGEKSLGFGATAPQGAPFLSQLSQGLPEEMIRDQTQKAVQAAKRKRKLLSKVTQKVPLKGKTIILVEDALATGSTAMAALQSLTFEKIIIASPAVSQQALDLLKNKVEQIIYLYKHPKKSFTAVSQPYQEYSEITNEEVVKILTQDD